jgi:hypothetical protein
LNRHSELAGYRSVFGSGEAAITYRRGPQSVNGHLEILDRLGFILFSPTVPPGI